jgi:hypothetical protein
MKVCVCVCVCLCVLIECTLLFKFCRSTLRDLWSSQRPLAGNPMSVESVKGEQTHLINKGSSSQISFLWQCWMLIMCMCLCCVCYVWYTGERPIICYIWLQGQRERNGTTYKVERCQRCLNGDTSENATSVLRVLFIFVSWVSSYFSLSFHFHWHDRNLKFSSLIIQLLKCHLFKCWHFVL